MKHLLVLLCLALTACAPQSRQVTFKDLEHTLVMRLNADGSMAEFWVDPREFAPYRDGYTRVVSAEGQVTEYWNATFARIRK